MLFQLHTLCELPVCRNHILLSDLEYFLDPKSAKECFDILDLDRDNKISLQVGWAWGQPCCLQEWSREAWLPMELPTYAGAPA